MAPDFLEQAREHVMGVLVRIWQAPSLPGERFYFVYVLTFVALAYVSYRLYYREQHPRFFRFLFPRKIYLHKSAITDYGIYVINLLIAPLLALVAVGLQTSLSIAIGNFLIGLNGGEPIVVGDWTASTYVLFIIGFTMMTDLSSYLVHRIHHQVDVLWPIHALHHSAEVLTPVTLYRKHPLWNLEAGLAAKAFAGVFQGLFLFVFYGTPQFEILFGVNTLYVVYNFFGSNLRHSHVWLSWGKPLSYVFISPAMHQIHHDPKRMNRNYGEVFALWDWAFGTLYIPDKREEFEIGLGEEGNPHDTIAKAYYVPVVDACRALGRKLKAATGS